MLTRVARLEMRELSLRAWRGRPAAAWLQVQVGGSPLYVVDKKLGKGGFGQVYLGRRAQPTKDKDGPNSNVVGAALRPMKLPLFRCDCPAGFVLMSPAAQLGAAADC